MCKIKIFGILSFCLLINWAIGKQGFGPSDQEWGYVTVRPKAHMFWWLHYTTSKDVNSASYEEKPLIIWIQGGPGVSGTGFGNFEEIGPLDTELQPRNHTWIKDYNVLFIDNPVGTGFSYVESPELYTKNNQQIAEDLMTCIQEFFQKLPRFAQTPTFILAESYGGKVTVEFANLWYKKQTEGNIQSNFKGIGLVDSLISTNDMYKSIAPYLFNFGMIDRSGYEAIDEAADKFVKASKDGDWINASRISNDIEYLMQKWTYHVDRLNVLKKVKPNDQSDLAVRSIFGNKFLYDGLYSKNLKKIMKKVKATLGLKNYWSVQESEVAEALFYDSRKPVVDQVEKLLNETNLKVYVFNGQLDLIINTPGTYSWIEKLNWKHSEQWLGAKRLPLVVNGIIEGYSKGYANLKFFWVNRSGHMIPAENPIAMEPILKDLIDGAM